jgi:hypothetical protein
MPRRNRICVRRQRPYPGLRCWASVVSLVLATSPIGLACSPPTVPDSCAELCDSCVGSQVFGNDCERQCVAELKGEASDACREALATLAAESTEIDCDDDLQLDIADYERAVGDVNATCGDFLWMGCTAIGGMRRFETCEALLAAKDAAIAAEDPVAGMLFECACDANARTHPEPREGSKVNHRFSVTSLASRFRWSYDQARSWRRDKRADIRPSCSTRNGQQAPR